jgi:hypothetical protein
MTTQGPNQPNNVTNDDSFGVDAWIEPELALIDDLLYANVANYSGQGVSSSNYLKFGDYRFSVPSGKAIQSVTVRVKRAAGLLDGINFAKDARLRLVKGGVVQSVDKADTQAKWPLIQNESEAAYVFTGSDLEGLTADDVNGEGFGVALAVDVSCDGITCNAYVNTVSVEIEHED